jgi:UDP-glucose 4-epimerase
LIRNFISFDSLPVTKVLITGVAGFIGSHTADLLLAEGHEVCGVDNFRTGLPSNITLASRSAQFQFYERDCAVPGITADLVESFRPTAIIHLAAMVSVPESIADPKENDRLNFYSTKLVAEAAHRFGVQRIVFASSAAVYGNNPSVPLSEDAGCYPLSPYGSAKFASEAHLLAIAGPALTVRCQRYFNVYGPRQDPRSAYSGVISRFAAALDLGQPSTIYGDGEQTRDFIAVADVARANLIAATYPGIATGTANVCTGRKVSLNELYSTMGRVWGKFCPPRYGPVREGDIRHSYGLPERAKTDLGFTATFSLEAGLKIMAA